MTTHSTAARRLATALSILVWMTGSAYLIQTELQASRPDWIVIVATPLIWVVVIALPILAHYALKDRNWLAAVLLTIAAVVGSAYTLQGTIARQTESRDAKVASAKAQNFTLDEKKAELQRAQQRYDDAQRFADDERGTRCGPRCQDWELRAREVKAHIDQLTAEISHLGPEVPVEPGNHVLAAAIALLPGVKAKVEDIEPVVATFKPSLFGVLLEIAALALGCFAWRPGVEVKTIATISPAKPMLALEMVRKVKTDEERAVIEALSRAGRPVSNDELAALMRVSKGESSKRVAALNGRLHVVRSGRENQISLLN